MDYKYIEQLLERYWQAETTVQEERILQAFFAQEVVPVHLAKWQPLFREMASMREASVSDDFDQRLMVRLSPQFAATPTVSSWDKVRRVLLGAVAVSGLFFIGAATLHLITLQQRSSNPVVVWDYNPDSYKDSYENPEAAYDESLEALKIISKQLSTIVSVDTIPVASNQ
ncbi:MAG: hypothetical protein J6R79_01640 [Bacteroidaceae bacterium]|nr:hypothetical protein [Bacteroidaceae bacterium]